MRRTSCWPDRRRTRPAPNVCGGHRRLSALQAIHRQGGDCVLSGRATGIRLRQEGASTGSRLDRKKFNIDGHDKQDVKKAGSCYNRKSPGVNPASWYGSKS